MHPKYLPWIWFYPLPVPWLKPYLQRIHGCISSSAPQSILYVSPRAHDDIIVVATVTMMSSCILAISQHCSIMANHLLLHQGGSFPGQVELTLITAQPPAAIRRYTSHVAHSAPGELRNIKPIPYSHCVYHRSETFGFNVILQKIVIVGNFCHD